MMSTHHDSHHDDHHDNTTLVLADDHAENGTVDDCGVQKAGGEALEVSGGDDGSDGRL